MPFLCNFSSAQNSEVKLDGNFILYSALLQNELNYGKKINKFPTQRGSPKIIFVQETTRNGISFSLNCNGLRKQLFSMSFKAKEKHEIPEFTVVLLHFFK